MEALFEIEFGALVHGNGMFQHGLVFAAEQLDQFSLSADELAVSQVMEILEYEEYTLKRAGSPILTFLPSICGLIIEIKRSTILWPSIVL